MEKGALIGMISLALSDLLFCLVTLSGTYLPGAQMIYYDQDFTFYYTIYANVVQNILIKLSTWITVILALSRLFVVKHPIFARQYMQVSHTVCAILSALVFWTLLHVPLCLMWKVKTIDCPVADIYILEPGIFLLNEHLNISFTIVWAITGFILPMAVLTYATYKLVHSLKISLKFKYNNSQTVPVMNRRCIQHSSHRLITVMLISIVVVFHVCVLPSEIVHLYEDLAQPDYEGAFRILMLTANLLQVFNFSINFILYCLVNRYFRSTLRGWFAMLPCLRYCLLTKTTDKTVTAIDPRPEPYQYCLSNLPNPRLSYKCYSPGRKLTSSSSADRSSDSAKSYKRNKEVLKELYD